MTTANTLTQTIVQPYLSFAGRCEEAINFYREALGAEVEMIMRFKDSPEQCASEKVPPGYDDKVMHAAFRIGESTIMATDCAFEGSKGFQGFSLSYSAPDEETVDRVFAALSKGGNVQVPLAKTFFSKRFGVVFDRFGISWMVLVHPDGQ